MKDTLTTLNPFLSSVSLLHSAVETVIVGVSSLLIISKIFEDIYTKSDWSYLANCDHWCVGYWLLDRLGLKCWFDVDLSLTSWLETRPATATRVRTNSSNYSFFRIVGHRIVYSIRYLVWFCGTNITRSFEKSGSNTE